MYIYVDWWMLLMLAYPILILFFNYMDKRSKR